MLRKEKITGGAKNTAHSAYLWGIFLIGLLLFAYKL